MFRAPTLTKKGFSFLVQNRVPFEFPALSLREERVTVEALKRDFGLEISNKAVLLTNLEPSEQRHLQRYPLLMHHDLNRDRAIRAKTEDPANWVVISRPLCDLEIYLCRVPDVAEIPSRYRSLWADREQAAAEFRRMAWTLRNLSGDHVRVLNIGCTTGHEAVLISELGPRRTVFSLDVLEELAAAGRAAKPRSVAASVLDLPFVDSSFDAIYSNNVVEHFYDIDQALREMHRVLVPSGVLISVLPTETNATNPFASKQLRAVRRWNPRRIDAGHPFKTDLYDLRWRLTENGFRRVTFAYDFDHFQQQIARLDRRNGGSIAGRHVLECLLSRLQESSLMFRLEHMLRSAFRLWRFQNYQLWLTNVLGLPEKNRQMLQVLCTAYK